MSKLSSFLHSVFGIAEKHITAQDIEDIVALAKQPGATAQVEAIAADWLKTEAMVLSGEVRDAIRLKLSGFMLDGVIDEIIDTVLAEATDYAVSKVDGLLTHTISPPPIKTGEVA